MSRIALSSGYTPIDKGTYKFLVVETEYKEDFGKIKLVFENEAGRRHKETFTIIGNNGKTNEKALYAFTQFAIAILNDEDIEDVDVAELLGSHVISDIVHDKVLNEQTGEERVYAHMKNLVPVNEIKPNFGKTDITQALPNGNEKPATNNNEVEDIFSSLKI